MNQCNRIVLYVIATLFNTSTSAIAQDSVIDSLKNLLATATDTTKVDLLIDIGKLYMAQEKHNNAVCCGCSENSRRTRQQTRTL